MSEAATTLEYARMPSSMQRWSRRLMAAGIVVVSNVVAAASTVIILVAAAVLAAIVLALISAFTNKEADSFLEITIALLLVGICFAIVFAVLALLLAPFIILTGITADAIRRALRWPWWTGFPAATLLGFLVSLMFNIITGGGILWAILNSILAALALTAMFCIYWIPLGCTESILRLIKWGGQKFFEWRHERKVAGLDAAAIPFAPALPGTSESPSVPDPAPLSSAPPPTSCD